MPLDLAPHENSREIERKFLVKRVPPDLEKHENRKIEQGYLASERAGAQVRLRKAGARHTMTAKRGDGVARHEWEIELSPAQFNQLWPATAGRRLTKTRYDVPCGAHTIEVDVYSGSNEGLIVAEVEFDDEKQCHDFEPPDWFGKEVSGKARYSNVMLARE